MEYIPNQFVNASHTIAASKKIDLIVGSEDPETRSLHETNKNAKLIKRTRLLISLLHRAYAACYAPGHLAY